MPPSKLDPSIQSFQEPRVCDGCPKVLEEGDHSATYFCDTKWGTRIWGKMPVCAPQDTYCLTCYLDEIPIPRKGTTECISLTTVRLDEEDETYFLEEREILRGSPSKDGIEWNPPEVFELIEFMHIEEMGWELDPMNTYTTFYRGGVDLKGFIRDKSLRIPESAEDTVKEVIRQNVQYQPRYSYETDYL